MAAAAALVVAWSGCARAKETKMDEAVYGKVERVNVGRFSLALPADVKWTGGIFEVRHLSLVEVALTPPDEEGWRHAWAAKRAEVESKKARRLGPSSLEGEIRIDQILEPERLAYMVYLHSAGSAIVTSTGLRRCDGGSGLWLTRASGLSFLDSVRERITQVAKAYRPVRNGEPRPSGLDVFHLPRGVVVQPFQDHEKASSIFKGGALGVEVDLSTESTPEPEGGGLMARFGAAVAKAGAAFAAGASPVRNRGRTVAGMKGEEFVMRDSENGKLYFMWEFKGEANSGARPEIQLEMITGDERQKEKMAFWDALVDSLRPAAQP
jgi:hypothetical protein